MFPRICRTLSLVLAGFLVIAPVLAAQQTGAAPVPPQVLHAHTVFIANGGGSNYFDQVDQGPNRAYNTFYKQLKQTHQYELVTSPTQADLVFEIRAIAPAESGMNDTVNYNPQVILTIRDPQTSTVLWTESANVRAFGTKKRRDRLFDQAVAVLVDKLAQVTGQPLTNDQTKAIAANSKMPTAEKIFIVSGIAAAATLTAIGIHMITSQPKPTLPPQPALQ